ncbi:MAG: 2-oxoisovalerate dehydrogenase [Bacteroidetes bacterium]|nr:2-oxoisovalerate dehydrogenase [Bacteroidota bacterium]MCH7771036.1 2-oxoisovalerate dehydrogenase [Bacteroidota bacterium]MCH9029015.1 2-oxoisovalerate dehydrogenase [Bacteroidota bacterium]
MKNKEIIFIVEESLDGGYEARAVGYSIFTEGETSTEVKNNIIEAVRCHFAGKDMPSLIHLRFQKEEVITL